MSRYAWVVLAGCWTGAPPGPPAVAQPAPPAQRRSHCPPHEIEGTLYDRHEPDEPLSGATVVVSGNDIEIDDDRDVAITNEQGGFRLKLRPGIDRVTIYYLDATFVARIPAEPCDLVAHVAPDAGAPGEVVDLVFEPPRRKR